MKAMLSEQEKEAIQKYFGVPFEELTAEEFKKTLKELRGKYHPDNFEKFADETVREMATERFQIIQTLAEKLEAHFAGKPLSYGSSPSERETFMHDHAVFAANKLRIDLLTSDKDLKYHLFGSKYRWLQFGDKFTIPETEASIVIDEDHRGTSIGYQESIRMYLTFDENVSIDKIVEWLYPRIKGSTRSLIIAGEKVEIEPFNIFYAIRKKAFVRVELPAGNA
jgi:hypothetical protein